MKNQTLFLTGIYFLVWTTSLIAQPNQYYDLSKYIENPSLYQENQEPPHVPLCSFDKPDQALLGDFSQSPFYSSMNGVWKLS